MICVSCMCVAGVMCGLVLDVLRSSVWDARTAHFTAPTGLRRAAYDCCSALCAAFGAGVMRWLTAAPAAGAGAGAGAGGSSGSSSSGGGVVLQVLHDLALAVQLRKTRLATALSATYVSTIHTQTHAATERGEGRGRVPCKRGRQTADECVGGCGVGDRPGMSSGGGSKKQSKGAGDSLLLALEAPTASVQTVAPDSEAAGIHRLCAEHSLFVVC